MVYFQQAFEKNHQKVPVNSKIFSKLIFFCWNLLEKAEKSNVNEMDQYIFQNLGKNEKQTFKD